MTGMELYVKFMFTLTIGVAGLGVVLKTVIDTLFADWDPVADFRRWWRHYSHSRSVASIHAEDILSELEGRRHGRYAPRPIAAIDRRREILREVREADERVAAPEAV